MQIHQKNMKMYEDAAETLKRLKIGLLSKYVDENRIVHRVSSEAALQRCSCEEVFWKYAANLQNTHAEVFSFKFAAYFQNIFSQEHI